MTLRISARFVVICSVGVVFTGHRFAVAAQNAPHPPSPVTPGMVNVGPTGESRARPTLPDATTVSKGLPTAMTAATEDQEKRYWAIERARASAEKDLMRLAHDHFQTGNKPVRQAGHAKIRQYTDGSLFPLMVGILRHEQRDVHEVLLDHFAELRTDDGDAMLAWLAVFDKNTWIAKEAQLRLLSRNSAWQRAEKKPGTPTGLHAPEAVTSVILAGLSSKEDTTIRLAGSVARSMKLFEIIPILIQGQLGQVGAAGGGAGPSVSSGTGSGYRIDDGSGIAWILIGRQIAYVADLIPVVSGNAVAFDPQLGVVTEGVVIRVIDAVVYAYRVEIHNQLVGLASDAAGKPMDALGWDQAKWQRWWKEEMQPRLAEQGCTGDP